MVFMLQAFTHQSHITRKVVKMSLAEPALCLMDDEGHFYPDKGDTMYIHPCVLMQGSHSASQAEQLYTGAEHACSFIASLNTMRFLSLR